MSKQLQFWNPKARAYVPSDAEPTAENARALSNGRGWRIVLTEPDDALLAAHFKPRPLLKPRYSRPPRDTRSARSRETVVAEYLAWAKAAGLKRITLYDRGQAYAQAFDTDYRGRITPIAGAVADDFEVRYVSRDDFIGDAPAPDWRMRWNHENLRSALGLHR